MDAQQLRELKDRIESLQALLEQFRVTRETITQSNTVKETKDTPPQAVVVRPPTQMQSEIG